MADVSRSREDLLKLADMHPELAAHFEKHKDDVRPAGLPELREYYQSLNRNFLNSFGPDSAVGVTIEDRTVLARDGFEIPIRTYRPAEIKEHGPLIISIHGGGFVLGGLVDEEGHCRTFVKEFGASCVNIDYRLAPEYKSPIGVHDCYDVVSWAAAHASELGANPSKGFIVQGVSAGAVLTDLVTRIAKDEKLDPPITGMLQIATVVCDSAMIPDKYKDEFLSWNQDVTPSLPRETITMFSQMRGAQPEDQWTSPMVNWPSGNRGLPKTVFMVHGRDVLRDIGLIYEKILREECGVETKLYLYPGLSHGFNMALAGGKAANGHLEDLLEGIRWMLRL